MPLAEGAGSFGSEYYARQFVYFIHFAEELNILCRAGCGRDASAIIDEENRARYWCRFHYGEQNTERRHIMDQNKASQ